MRLQFVQYDLQHDFAWVADEAYRSVVLALLQVAFLGKYDDQGLGPQGWPFSCPPDLVANCREGSDYILWNWNGDPSELNCPQTHTEDDHPILCKEMEAAVQPLKKRKSAGVDNISAELVQAGGEDVITALTTIYNKIWQAGEWPTSWTQSLVITFPKEGHLQQCQNYQTISLISHPSKVMLKTILNRLKPQVEKIIAEEQAGFRADRSTTEQIFNL